MKKISTLLVGLLGFTGCLTASDYKSEEVSFYDVPLVCGASSTIGCGSSSKLLLMELEDHSQIKEAWLNRGGTVIAIVWETGTTEGKTRNEIAKPLFDKYEVPMDEIEKKNDRSEQLETFGQEGKWYKGTDVDQLSIEEAGIIANSVITAYLNAKIITEEQAKSMRTDIEAYFKTELVKVRTKENLYGETTQAEWKQAMIEISEKYLGKGNVPEIQIQSGDTKEKNCKQEKQCCKK